MTFDSNQFSQDISSSSTNNSTLKSWAFSEECDDSKFEEGLAWHAIDSFEKDYYLREEYQEWREILPRLM